MAEAREVVFARLDLGALFVPSQQNLVSALGSAARLGNISYSRSQCGRRVHDGFEFDRGQRTQSGLSSASVVGSLDSCHDRDV